MKIDIISLAVDAIYNRVNVSHETLRMPLGQYLTILAECRTELSLLPTDRRVEYINKHITKLENQINERLNPCECERYDADALLAAINKQREQIQRCIKLAEREAHNLK